MIEWQWRVARLLVWMQFYSSTVAELITSHEETKLYKMQLNKETLLQQAWEKARHGSSTVWENPHRPFTTSGLKWFDRREWLNGTHPSAFKKKKTWFWLKIQSTWKSYDIRQQAYNNVIVHILYSMCSAQVHMVTQHWENTRHHVVQVKKWEHLQF